jgi:biotin carboxyl carrier protein
MKEYKLKINGNNYRVAVKDYDGQNAKVEVNGTLYTVEMEEPAKSAVRQPQVIVQAAPINTGTNQPPKTASPASAGAVRAPLPGVVLDVYVRMGEQVQAGQKLLMLEAMKMENIIEAHTAGKVAAVKVNRGDSVLEGAELVLIE